jgi:RNA polymerase sigma-70 factor (ECF subfamily)
VYGTVSAEDEDGSKSIFEIKDEARSPEELLTSKERIQLLLQSMEKLPPIQRTLISLFHQQELSLEEISVITALPVNTIKSYLHRGRQALKNEMIKRLNH